MLNATIYRTVLSESNTAFSFSSGSVSLNIELLWDDFTQSIYDKLNVSLNKKAMSIAYSVDGVFTHPSNYLSYIEPFTEIPTLYTTASADVSNENSFDTINTDLSDLIVALQSITYVDIKNKEIYNEIISNLQICKNACIQENRTLLNETFPPSTNTFLVLCNAYLVEYNEVEPAMQMYEDMLHWTVKITNNVGDVRYIVLHNNVFYYSEDSTYFVFIACSVNNITKDTMPNAIGMYIGVIDE